MKALADFATSEIISYFALSKMGGNGCLSVKDPEKGTRTGNGAMHCRLKEKLPNWV